MTKYWWLILVAYPACGLMLGFADPILGHLVRQLGIKPGVATAVSVNLLLSLAALALALAHNRLWAAWFGAATMTFGFLEGLAACYPARVREWSPLGILSSVPPVLVAAGLGYAILGTVAVLIGRARRALTPAGAK
jgi:hypothetical protein